MKSLLLFLAIASAAFAQQPVRVEFPTQCGPGGCFGGSCQPQYYGPQYSQPQQQRPSPDGVCTPPVGSQGTPQFQPLPPPPPVQTPPITPPCPPQPTIDWAAWQKQQQERHDALMAAQEAGFKSIVVAINGLPKCNCQPTDLTEINAKLDALAVSCKPTTPPPVTQPAAEEHVVVVADHNAPYWQKLAEQLARTRQTYKGVQDTTLPDFPIGIHPQLIVYRNSVPIRIVKGQHEVDDLLSRLARGDAI